MPNDTSGLLLLMEAGRRTTEERRMLAEAAFDKVNLALTAYIHAVLRDMHQEEALYSEGG